MDLTVRIPIIFYTSSEFWFLGADGAFGLGLPATTIGSLSSNESEIISTVTDSLDKNDIIHENMTAIFVPPPITNILGRVDFGGINMDGVTSDINFVPNSNISGSGFNQPWAVNLSIT